MCVVHQTPSLQHAIQGSCKGDRVFHFEEQGAILRDPGGEVFVLKWVDVLAGRNVGLQVWQKGISSRDPLALFRGKRSEKTLYNLTHALSIEMFGDVCQTSRLVNAYKSSLNILLTSTKKELTGKVEEFRQLSEIPLTGTKYTSVMERIDAEFKKAIMDCYENFHSFVEPIVSAESTLQMIEYYKKSLPHHYRMMKSMLEFDKKESLIENKHLVQQGYYDKRIFYQFLSLCRTKNCHNCPHWALTSKLADYGRGITDYSHSSNIFFGNSTSYNHLVTAIQGLSSNTIAARKKRLSKEKILVATMDNNQRGYPIKYPRKGCNSNFIKVTGRTFVEASKIEFNLTEDFKCEVEYTDQKIISAMGMPHFEKLVDGGTMDYGEIVNALENPASITNDQMVVDITGMRVKTYVDLLTISSTLQSASKYLSGYNATTKKYKKWEHQLPMYSESEIRKKCMKKIARLKNEFFSKSNMFQKIHTEMWNPNCKKVAKFIVPPVSLEDEMTNKGFKRAILEILELAGILDSTQSENKKGEMITRWELTELYEEKKLYLCMDGLSLERYRAMEKNLMNQSFSFSEEYKQKIITKKALGRVVQIPGPLHMAFHMCQCIFTIYSDFLKNCQVVVGWKKINFLKVSESFRQCKALLFVALDEAERLMWDIFLEDKSDIILKKENSLPDKVFCVWLAQYFTTFVEDMILNSSDERRQLLASFITSVRIFKIFCDSIRTGDRLYQEHAMIKFIGVFLLLKIYIYVDLCLNAIEREYHDIDYESLMHIRINSCVMYRVGKDSNGNYYLAVALDEMQENVNGWTKIIVMDNELGSWQRHSPNVTVARKCVSFIDGEYKKNYLYLDRINRDEEIEHGRKSYKNNTAIPTLRVEKSRLYEFFTKLFSTELENRRYKNADAHNIIKNLTTKLNPEEDKKDVFVEEVEHSTVNQDEDVDDNGTTNNEADETTSSSNRAVDNEEDTLVDDALATDKSFSVKKLCFKNIFTVGEEKMNQSDMKASRFNKQRRLARYEKLLDSVYFALSNRKHDLLLDSHEQELITPNYRKEYNSSINPDYKSLITEAMNTVWLKQPRTFQESVIMHLLKMGKNNNNIAPVLLVQGTGGGKSLVMQTVGVVKSGVTLTIENTLSLSSDQMSKIRKTSNKDGKIIALHLDAIKNEEEKKDTEKLLMGLNKNRSTTVFLFSSPEKILEKFWMNILKHLIRSGTLKMCCVDEVHQFVSYGCFFRYEFEDLRDSLFKNLLEDVANNSTGLSNYTKIPLLFMTATFSSDMKNLLQKMIGINILRENVFWGNVDAMKRRNVTVQITSHPQYLEKLKVHLNRHLKDNSDKKAIVYTNTAAAAQRLKEKIDTWLDHESPFEGDAVIVYGDMHQEVKSEVITAFTNINSVEQCKENDSMYPRILIATSGSIGAGLDSSKVTLVYRIGCPSSLFDFIQEMGRCGRDVISAIVQYHNDYIVNISLEDYVYMYERIHTDTDKKDGFLTISAQNELQTSHLLCVLKFIVLKAGCMHKELEILQANSNGAVHGHSTCNNACPICTKEHDGLFMPVIRDNVRVVLAKFFIRDGASLTTPMQLCKKLQEVEDYHVFLFDKKRKKDVCVYHIKALVMQLLATEIITLKMKFIPEKRAHVPCCALGMNEKLVPSYADDLLWEGMAYV